MLTISATFGVLVLIFQDGRFEGLLGYTSQGGLESSQPVLLFAVAFGRPAKEKGPAPRRREATVNYL